MVNYGRVQFVSIGLGISPITLIHNRLHAWECFLVAPQKERLTPLFFVFISLAMRCRARRRVVLLVLHMMVCV